jgi:hypothetical protein
VNDDVGGTEAEDSVEGGALFASERVILHALFDLELE